MSVGVLVQFKSPDRETLYVPVATEGTYSRYWVSAAERLGLLWLPEFQTGAIVPLDALPAVIAEFEQVRAEFARRPDMTDRFIRQRMDVATMQELLERADNVLEALKGLDPAEVNEIFIG